MIPSKRRFLVMVRAGANSLHRDWLVGAERNWDLVVSWFGDTPYEVVADEVVLNAKGGKWDVLHDQLTVAPELVAGYDHVWFPDDDIEADAARVNRLFEISARYRLELSQPALTPNSYFSYIHTLEARSFTLRYTSLVEVMVPCLSQAALQRAMPLIKGSRTGWGIDHIWCRLAADNRDKSAIVDAAAVRHTRPIGRVLAAKSRAAGHDGKAAGRALLRQYGLGRPRREFYCTGGVDRHGRRRGRGWTWAHMLIDYLSSAGQWVEPKAVDRFFRSFYYGYRRTSLSQLRPVEPDGSAEDIERVS